MSTTDVNGPVPKEPIRENSVTNFNLQTGDSSRAVLWTVLVLAAVLLLGILLFTTYRQ